MHHVDHCFATHVVGNTHFFLLMSALFGVFIVAGGVVGIRSRSLRPLALGVAGVSSVILGGFWVGAERWIPIPFTDQNGPFLIAAYILTMLGGVQLVMAIRMSFRQAAASDKSS